LRITGEGVAALQIVNSGQGVETFFLWFVDDVDTSVTWIVRSMWLSMLRESMIDKNPVLITHGDTSGRVEIVEMDRE
jgi:hypothetical protein